MKKYLTGIFSVFLVSVLTGPNAFPQTALRNFWSSIFGQDVVVSKPQVVQPEAVDPVVPVATSLHSVSAQLIADKCETYRPYIEQAKVVMEKKNELEKSACQLYRGWAVLWRASNCDAQAFADAESVPCPGDLGALRYEVGDQPSVFMLPSCDEIFGKWQTSSNWTHAGIQACDYSLFETGCRPMADAAEDCGTRQCQQNCTFKYACDSENFKRLISATPIYFNDPGKLQGCMDQLRRAGL